MIHEEGYFQNHRNTKIYWQSWLPQNETRAVLLIVHGYDDHTGRWMNVVNYFVPKRFTLYGMDLIGHGKSEGTRGYVKKFEDFTETLQLFLRIVRDKQADKPIIMIGFSLGALITSVYLLDYQKDLSGAILIGGAVKIPDYVSAFTIILAKILSAVIPKIGIFAYDEDEEDGISRDKTVIEAFRNDPLVYRGKVKARLGAEELKALIRLNKEGSQITLPVLIVHGNADQFVDPENAQLTFNLIQSKDKQIKIYDGLYHEVFNEPECEIVFEDLEEWMNQRI